MKLEWKTCFRIGVTALALIICVMLLPKLGAFLPALLSAASPLIIGCVIAYIANILMVMYEKIYFPKAKKKFLVNSRRPICLTLAFVTVAFVIVLVIALVVPELVSCVMLLLEKIPAAIKEVIKKLDEQQLITDELVAMLNSIDWKSRLNQIFDAVTSGIGGVVDVVVGTVASVFSGLVTALIAVIFAIYLLSAKESLSRQYGLLTKRYIKPSVTEKMNHIFSVMNDCFRRYIIGQCTEAVILGALCTLGMWIFKFPYATMIGALVAFTALIPVAGAYIGAFVGAFMILTVSPIKALLFLVYIVVLQQLEGNIIYPRVVGSSVGLPGLWVLAAVTVGGGLFGIMGMLVGVPLAATAYRLLREDVSKAAEPSPVCVEAKAEEDSPTEDSAAEEPENA